MPLRPFALNLSFVALFTCSLPLCAEELRNWVDDQGRTVSASIASVSADSVTLRLADGKEIPFPIAKLSKADQEFLAAREPAGEEETKMAAEDAPSSTAEEEGAGMPDPENLPTPEEWPTSVSVGTSIEVEEVESEEEGSYIFRTEHFEFHCDAQLGKNVISEFARLFEATYAAIDQSPLPLLNRAVEKHRVVRLFAEEAGYVDAGGMPEAAGIFIGRTKEVLVPLESVGVKKVGSRYTIESRDDNETLIHEIVHQLTWHWDLGVWWSEGLAEYFAGADYNPGRLKFTNHSKNLREYMKKKKGVWEEDYAALHPDDLLAMEHGTWNSMVGSGGRTGGGLRNYASANILFYFFCHLDKDKDGAPMLAYMQAVKAGMDVSEATQTFLLRDRDGDGLAEEVAKGWRGDLKLTFDHL